MHKKGTYRRSCLWRSRHIRSPAKCRFGGNPCLAEWYFAGLAGSRNDRSSPRHEFDLCSYSFLRSSRCDRNIIDSRELSLERLAAGLSNKSGGVAHNNSISVFRARGIFDDPTTYFRDPPVLFSRTCWSLLNWRLSLHDVSESAHLSCRETSRITEPITTHR